MTGFVDRADAGFGADWRALYARISADGKLLARPNMGTCRGIDAFWTGAAGVAGRPGLAGSRRGSARAGSTPDRPASAGGRQDLGEQAFGGGGYDRFTGMARAADGHVFLGHSEPEGADAPRSSCQARPSGLPCGSASIDATRNAGARSISSRPADGGLIVAGGTDRGGDSDMFVIKLDGEGRELWRKRVGTPHWDGSTTACWSGRTVDRPRRLYPSAGERGQRHARRELFADGGRAARAFRRGRRRPRDPRQGRTDGGTVWSSAKRASAGAGESDLIADRLDASGAFTGRGDDAGGPADDNGTAVLPLGPTAVRWSPATASISARAAGRVRCPPVAGRLAAAPNPAFAARVGALGELGQVERLEQARRAASMSRISAGSCRSSLWISSGHVAFDHFGDPIEPGLVDQEARIDRRWVGDDPQAQAGGTAAVGHRLADVDHFDPADRAVAGEVALQPAPHRGVSRASLGTIRVVSPAGGVTSWALNR